MGVKDLLQADAGSFGYELASTKRTGMHYWLDVDRIKPMRSFRTIVDVGAHHGESALQFVRRAPDAAVFSFEPSAASYERLTANVAALTNVTCIRSAVGSAPGEVMLYHRTWSQANSLRPPATGTQTFSPAAGSSERVPITTLDAFAAERGLSRIDLLKTDTEGYDVEVLRGASGLLAEGRIDFLYSEVAFDPEDREHTNFADLFQYVTAAGLRLLGLYELAQWPSPWRIAFCNALFTRL